MQPVFDLEQVTIINDKNIQSKVQGETWTTSVQPSLGEQKSGPSLTGNNFEVKNSFKNRKLKLRGVALHQMCEKDLNSSI